jgi:nucleoid-associated protein YgaU
MRTKDGDKSPGERRGSVLWLFLLLFFLFGAGFYLSAHQSLGSLYARLNEWMKPPVVKTDDKVVASATVAPTFDIVRAEPTGELVIAGRAEPGWSVSVESGGRVIGETKANENGEWVLESLAPLAAGEHSLSLKATERPGSPAQDGQQRIALSILPKEKREPVVALTEQGKATRLLQQPAQGQTGEAPQPAKVTFNALDYEKTVQEGKIYLSGEGPANGRVMLYINNAFIGMAAVGADGQWTFSGASDLPPGDHVIRADSVDIGTGKVIARAEVNFEQAKAREAFAEVKPPAETGARQTEVKGLSKDPFEAAIADMARKESATSPSTETRTPAVRSEPAGETAAASVTQPKRPPAQTASVERLRLTPTVRQGDRARNVRARRRCRSVTVRSGDTLWLIARRCYGAGERFSKIFHSNQGQIRDPDVIYPNQRFVVPR